MQEQRKRDKSEDSMYTFLQKDDEEGAEMAVAVNRYREEVDAKRILQIREICRGLPQACSDFLRAIAVTTGTFTRLAYAIDLNTFFQFLHLERIYYAQKEIILYDDQDLDHLSQSDLTAYTEYLTYYLKSDDDHTEPERVFVNHDLAIKRKLCSIRSFYDYLFKHQRIAANVTELVPLPKIHEKPILRLSRSEMEKMLSTYCSGTPVSCALYSSTVMLSVATAPSSLLYMTITGTSAYSPRS